MGKCSRVLYIVDGNVKGEYNLNKSGEAKQIDREPRLSNWLMEMLKNRG